MCCGRLKKGSKLKIWDFCEMLQPVPPKWVVRLYAKRPSPAPLDWPATKKTWFESLDALFSAESYLNNFFRAQERCIVACADVKKLPPGPERKAAVAFAIQVVEWRKNVLHDLVANSLASPWNPDVRWLWHVDPQLEANPNPGFAWWSGNVDMCKKCYQAPGKLNRCSDVIMLSPARLCTSFCPKCRCMRMPMELGLDRCLNPLQR